MKMDTDQKQLLAGSVAFALLCAVLLARSWLH
jgi:hypothetical protein